jgi:hypothetical protein
LETIKHHCGAPPCRDFTIKIVGRTEYIREIMSDDHKLNMVVEWYNNQLSWVNKKNTTNIFQVFFGNMRIWICGGT